MSIDPQALSIAELADLLQNAPDAYEPISFDTSTSPETSWGFSEAPTFAGQVPVESGQPAPRHFAPSADVARALNVLPQAGDEDPIRQAWKAGFDDGVATEKRLAQEMRGEDVHAVASLNEQIRQIGPEAMQLLESRLRDTVVALCRQVVDDCPISPDHLANRITTAVQMLVAGHNKKTIEVNPQDHPLLTGLLPAEWTLAANPGLARGALRVSNAEGGIEDGPEQWKRALEEAIRTC